MGLFSRSKHGNGGNGTGGASKAAEPENEHVVYAKMAYATFKSEEGAAVKQLHDYYVGIRRWAGIKKESPLDTKIMGGFKKLANGYDAETEVEIWKDLNRIWLTHSITGPKDDKRIELADKIDSISIATPKEDVERISRSLLANHVIFKPKIEEVSGEPHYNYFVNNVVVRSRIRDDYSGNDHAWWLVHNVLQNSWLKNEPDIFAGRFDDLKEKPKAPEEPVPEEPKAKPIEPITDAVLGDHEAPAPPPMPFAFSKEGIAPKPPVATAQTFERTRKPAEPVDMLREDSVLASINFDEWMAHNLKPIEKAVSLTEDSGEYRIFEAATLKSAIKNGEAQATLISGNEQRMLQNAIYRQMIDEIDAAIRSGRSNMESYMELVTHAMHTTRVINPEAEQEAILMAGLIVAEQKVSKADMARYKKYLGTRVEAIKNGYNVLFDLNGKVYIARKGEGED